MAEALVGILFAASFIIIYLLASRLRRGGAGRSISSEVYPPVMMAPNRTGTQRDGLSLTTEELSGHHSRALAGPTRKQLAAGKTTAAPDQQRESG
ncbi:MAG TPA: hypothetical protein VGB17_08655 [Pyrinomonadaceae bacterium]|jgi:hypothetical protein